MAQIARASEEVVAENRRAEADEDDEPPVMEVSSGPGTS